MIFTAQQVETKGLTGGHPHLNCALVNWFIGVVANWDLTQKTEIPLWISVLQMAIMRVTCFSVRARVQMTINEVIMNFSLRWRNSVNSRPKWIIALNVFLLAKWIQNFVDNCGYLRFLGKWDVTKTRCTTLCLALLWLVWSLNMSKCSPYVWQHWPLLLQQCQGGCVPRSADVRQCCLFYFKWVSQQ